MQCKFSEAVIFFKDGFFKKWGCSEYLDDTKETIFVGCFNNDVEIILNHKGKKTVMFLGGDIQNVSKLKHDKNVVFASDKDNILQIYKDKGLRFNPETIDIKDYSLFIPTPKGEKIYCYINNDSKGCYNKFKLDLLEPAIKYFGKDMFLFGTHGNTIEEMIENFYKPSFINIMLNPLSGFTTAKEMSLMGRKTISNNPASFCIPFQTPDDIIQIIKKEML